MIFIVLALICVITKSVHILNYGKIYSYNIARTTLLTDFEFDVGENLIYTLNVNVSSFLGITTSAIMIDGEITEISSEYSDLYQTLDKKFADFTLITSCDQDYKYEILVEEDKNPVETMAILGVVGFGFVMVELASNLMMWCCILISCSGIVIFATVKLTKKKNFNTELKEDFIGESTHINIDE